MIYLVSLVLGLSEGAVDNAVFGVLCVGEEMNDDDPCLQWTKKKENMVPFLLKNHL